jgi:hypothetical protein
LVVSLLIKRTLAPGTGVPSEVRTSPVRAGAVADC